MRTRRTLVLKAETLSELRAGDLADVVGAAAIPTLDEDCKATRTCIPTCLDLTCRICD